MTGNHQATDNDLLGKFCRYVASDLQLLAVLHSEELTWERIQALKESEFPNCLGYLLAGDEIEKVLVRLDELVKSWPEQDAQDADEVLDDLAADYAGIYLNHTYNASPMESVWIDEENLAFQQPMFVIRDRYKKHGLAMENWRLRSDDHLVSQMQFIAWLLEADQDDRLSEVAEFMDEHLLRWLDQFSRKVANRCHTEFYALLAFLTSAYLEEIREMLVEILGVQRPTEKEIEERMKIRYAPVQEVNMQYMPGVAESW